MKPWEKCRDEFIMDGGPLTPDYQEGLKDGFNAATEYWQKHIEQLVEALIKMDRHIAHNLHKMEGVTELHIMIRETFEAYRKATQEEL